MTADELRRLGVEALIYHMGQWEKQEENRRDVYRFEHDKAQLHGIVRNVIQAMVVGYELALMEGR